MFTVSLRMSYYNHDDIRYTSVICKYTRVYEDPGIIYVYRCICIQTI